MADGPVNAILETNGVVYLGGSFSSLYSSQQRTSVIHPVSGQPQPGFPAIDGFVNTAINDGFGGWYLGGQFSTVGELPRTNLVHLLADQSVDPSWNPGANEAVHALAAQGEFIFVGGGFTAIAGQPRAGLAAVHRATGLATAWNPDMAADDPPGSRGQVLAIEIQGTRIFAGGAFTRVGGQPRTNLVALDLVDASPLPGVLDAAGAASVVHALRATETTLFVGGRFSSFATATRTNVAALDLASGTVRAWNPGANGEVLCLAVANRAVYVGGNFTSIGGASRPFLAALDPETGLATSWNPAADGAVSHLIAAGRTVHVGGDFAHVGGSPREGLGALDAASGKSAAWNPGGLGRSVNCLALEGDRLLVSTAGRPGQKSRNRLAALNARTGEVLDWNPGADDTVWTLAVAGSNVFAGGDFLHAGGVPRIRVAAIHATTGLPVPWVTDTRGPNGRVWQLAADGDRLYVGGGFSAVGTSFSPGLAALDQLDGHALAWKPIASSPVLSLAVVAGRVFAAGNFTSIGGQARNGFAELDPITALATGWDPGALGTGPMAGAMVIHEGTAYVTGNFTNLGAQPRLHLGAVNLSSGAVQPWSPAPGLAGDAFTRLAVDDLAVYVSGNFSSIAGQPRRSAAALDRATGALLDWHPDPVSITEEAPVSTLTAGSTAIYLGGSFTSIGGRGQANLAAFPSLRAPRITLEPADLTVEAGQPGELHVEFSGAAPVFCQWQRDGTNVIGGTNTVLTIGPALETTAGSYVAVVTNAFGLVQSRSARVTLLQPLSILRQPVPQLAAPGAPAAFRVEAIGSPTPRFQWKLNGMILPGETSPTLTFPAVTTGNGGRYNVTIFNGVESIESDVVELAVSLAQLPLRDDFEVRETTHAASGAGFAYNEDATSQDGEIEHGGRPGGHSVWYSWVAPANGIAVFHTQGSSFDTLLAVYTNTSVAGTNLVVADDDQGGFLTSRVSFNATAGREYQIAVDGCAGAIGRLMLSWALEPTTDQSHPVSIQPAYAAVRPGENLTLRAVTSAPGSATYQWLRNLQRIPGATRASLSLTNLTESEVGSYSVEVRTGTRVTTALATILEMGPQPTVVSRDKPEDLFIARPPAADGALEVAMGSADRQILNNTGSGCQPGEPRHAGTVGGRSRWLRFRPLADGVLRLDTRGSVIDTAIAAYTGTHVDTLSVVGADDNGAPDRVRSEVLVSVSGGTNYLVAMDGTDGAEGRIALNWQLGSAPRILSSTQRRAAREGEKVTLAVTVTNAVPPPSYQWQHNGHELRGQTNSLLQLPAVSLAQAGEYSVVISNFAGTLTHLAGVVTVAAPFPLRAEWVRSGNEQLLRLTGPAAGGLVVEASTDLSVWLPLYTNVTVGVLDYLDRQSAVLPARFYRVAPWP